MFHNLFYVFADSLPLGSYCSFELGSCGWLVAYTQSSWRLVSGQQLTEDTDLLGKTLQNTQGKCETTYSSHYIGYPSKVLCFHSQMWKILLYLTELYKQIICQ